MSQLDEIKSRLDQGIMPSKADVEWMIARIESLQAAPDWPGVGKISTDKLYPPHGGAHGPSKPFGVQFLSSEVNGCDEEVLRMNRKCIRCGRSDCNGPNLLEPWMPCPCEGQKLDDEKLQNKRT